MSSNSIGLKKEKKGVAINEQGNGHGRSYSYAPLPYPEDVANDPTPSAYKRKRTAKPSFFTGGGDDDDDADADSSIGGRAPALVGRIAAYCTAEMYELGQIFDHYRSRGLRPSSKQESVLVEIKGSSGLAVFFTYGVVVMWGLTVVEERDVLSETDPFRVNPVGDLEVDDLEYTFGESVKIQNDRIILDAPEPLVKLALSHAVAQSTRLSFFEDEVESMILETRDLPLQLAKTGKISLSRVDLSKRIAHLFIQKSNVNLQSGITDTPDFIWDNQQYEKYYNMVRSYLEIPSRTKALNGRLLVLQELFDMLKTESQTRSTERQEWIVITLIITELSFLAAELTMTFFKDYIMKE